MPGLTERSVQVSSNALMAELVGEQDTLLKTIERSFPDAQIFVRGNEVTIRAPEATTGHVENLFRELIALLERGHGISAESVERSIGMVRAERAPSEIFGDIVYSGRSKVRPKTLGQKAYVDAIRAHTVVFGIGPAGTGKTYLAVALAVQALAAKQVRRIILTRPALEAGERLGFLPGDMIAKIDPYLRPLYDAMYDMMDPEAIPRLMERGTIEVAPLAFMRGRTLNDSFIILDEAQNTTPEQMKMFLTRIGFGSRAVVTGDVTQTDLPDGRLSGLRHVRSVLRGIDDLAFVELGNADVVRHRIVQDIVTAYERADIEESQLPAAAAGGARHRQGPGRRP